MNSTFKRNRRNSLIRSALVCIVVLAITLSILQNTISGGTAAAFNTKADFIEFIDVGQGDSAIIYSNGYCAVIDVGEPEAAPIISKTLDDYGITVIDALIISHLHSDHVGSLPEITELYKVDNLFMPEILNRSIVSAKTGKENVISKGSAFYEAEAGMNFQIGEFTITLLGYYDDSYNENNRSIFVMAQIDDTKILFTGDAEARVEHKLLSDGIDVDCDILKVGHHGSNTSSTKTFIAQASPDYAVISVGENNSYSHPHSDPLKTLKNNKAEIYRTDLSGDITFDFTEDKIIVKTQKQ